MARGIHELNLNTDIINIDQKLFIKLIDNNNLFVFQNLAQAYEAEFSSITDKSPNAQGLFSLDTLPTQPCIGYLVYQETSPLGFCVLDIDAQPMYIAEFYIIPSQRKKKIGIQFSHYIFSKHPGYWQVQQIKGADNAVKFWRKSISIYTLDNYKEEMLEDPVWGQVTRQTFLSISSDL
ncbi:MAG: hypothetical protein KBD64_01875 [Gammaproteobacteria bacterium]|nr:hypothetical protein [Gammaproteobacteria bacterium]